MMDLIALYWITILAAMFVGACLSVMGALIVTRDMTVQSLSMSQAASLGIIAGILLGHFFPRIEHWAPAFLGIIFSTVSFLFLETAAKKRADKNVFFLSFFVLFWAITQLVMGFFPGLEGHKTALYFGDIVTISNRLALGFLFLALLFTVFFFCFGKKLLTRTFFSAVLGESFSLRHKVDIAFYAIVVVMLSISIQLLGLLFSLACLFLPTSLYSFSRKVGAINHLVKVWFFALVAIAGAFLLSLYESRILTSPGIAVFLALIPALYVLLETKNRCK